LYDFECADCGERFEALILHNSGSPVCPSCKSQNLEQLISMFSVNSENTREANLKGVRAKNAKIRKDKAMAELDHHD
jgi:putative FmdB family regulatory protein